MPANVLEKWLHPRCFLGYLGHFSKILFSKTPVTLSKSSKLLPRNISQKITGAAIFVVVATNSCSIRLKVAMTCLKQFAKYLRWKKEEQILLRWLALIINVWNHIVFHYIRRTFYRSDLLDLQCGICISSGKLQQTQWTEPKRLQHGNINTN